MRPLVFGYVTQQQRARVIDLFRQSLSTSGVRVDFCDKPAMRRTDGLLVGVLLNAQQGARIAYGLIPGRSGRADR